MNLDPEILEVIYTNEGDDLNSLSFKQPILLIFLRHFGCIFCRETLSDMVLLRNVIEAKGLKIVMVHMAAEETANDFFDRYRIPNIAHISDPDLSLYEYFGLSRGNFTQLFGLKVWVRGFETGFVKGHGIPYTGKGLGKANQMPGIFILEGGKIEKKFIHNSAADHPDYLKIVEDFLTRKSRPYNKSTSE